MVAGRAARAASEAVAAAAPSGEGREAPEGWPRSPHQHLMLERREVDLPTGRAHAHWLFVTADGTRRELSFDHRLYTAAEYATLFRRVGLEPAGWFGGFDGSELTVDSWRLIAVAQRPA